MQKLAVKMKSLLKKKYQTLILILIVGIIFYLLQVLIMSQLGHVSRKMDSGKYINKVMDLNEDEGDPIVLSRNRIVDAESKFDINDNELKDKLKAVTRLVPIVDKSKKEVTKNVYLENNYLKVVNENRNNEKPAPGNHAIIKEDARVEKPSKTVTMKMTEIRGVHPADLKLYWPDSQGMVRCLKAKELKIRPNQINDDFCDCPDSSDEPGTSACPDGRFYCLRQLQLQGMVRQFVPSSCVNDGICDCCDGSDEWGGNTVPDFMRIKDGEPAGAARHAPCSDTCASVLAANQREDALRLEGRKLQQRYVNQAARELRAVERNRFGPNGVFYPLSKTCFSLKANHYEYKVCPFSKVTQKADGGREVTLGKTPSLHVNNGEHMLEMRDGDSHLCPSGQKRIAKIRLGCGLKEVLIKVEETEVCQYLFTLVTPAGC